jgi:hypothetical protein
MTKEIVKYEQPIEIVYAEEIPNEQPTTKEYVPNIPLALGALAGLIAAAAINELSKSKYHE